MGELLIFIHNDVETSREIYNMQNAIGNQNQPNDSEYLYGFPSNPSKHAWCRSDKTRKGERGKKMEMMNCE